MSRSPPSEDAHRPPGKAHRFARRWARARAMGVAFRGMARTVLPARIRWGEHAQELHIPEGENLVPDFVNVVLDDDYGLRSLAPPPRTVVDIGANVGLFALHARWRFPEATIHAYEPSPQIADFARRNAAGRDILVFAEGVARASGRARMSGSASSNLAQTRPDLTGDIVLSSFEMVIERIGRRIDLLKIDCEGAEWDFMRDAALFAEVGAIRMEYHLVDDRSLADFAALVDGIGFRVTRLLPSPGFGIAWLDRAA